KHGHPGLRPQLKADLECSTGRESRADDVRNYVIGRLQCALSFHPAKIAGRASSSFDGFTTQPLRWPLQQINGLSPTSQFSSSGGAGNAPARGAAAPKWPSR